MRKLLRARRIHLSLALLFSIVSVGCISTRAVTPWLRTSSHRDFEQPSWDDFGEQRDWLKTERLLNGVWVEISNSDRAMALDGGRLAVYVNGGYPILTNEAGDTVRLNCVGELRATPDGETLVCVTTSQFLEEDEAHDIKVVSFDLRGQTTYAATLKLNVFSMPRPAVPYFVGFLADSTPVLAMHVLPARVQFGFRRENECAAFALRADGVILLDRLVTTRWQCHEPGLWRDRTGLELYEGSAMISAWD